MTVLLASVSEWVILLVGAAVLALAVLLSVEFGHQARRIRILRAERDSERADFAAWYARHTGRFCEGASDAAEPADPTV